MLLSLSQICAHYEVQSKGSCTCLHREVEGHELDNRFKAHEARAHANAGKSSLSPAHSCQQHATDVWQVATLAQS